ncbi:MAG: TerB family tellurite resistance protein [Myxococcales bacterium]|nr:TerB family tellurite resistance protein [Myxococcales bacterium]MCB9753409.1 TerB family tellurite resistance protein [Myxococcales bacterium]
MSRKPPSTSTIQQPMTDEDRVDLGAIAFVFLACSELTDCDLSSAEMGAIVSRIHTWLPVGDEPAVERALRAAVAEYEALETAEARLDQLGAHAARLRARLNHEQRTRIITDLITIAEADGRVLDAERGFIEAAARTFEVDLCACDPRASDPRACS